ncbi:MAG: hypothetical protein OER80_14455 [Gammaproteobacteria bacterium]|nr:hypothetical protein [Gammaproteobacteria bacterium]MDH3769046.1 hypothetical protein [Gammaproteobacteria bacterium]
MNKVPFAVTMLIVAVASFVVGSQWNSWFARSPLPVAAPGKKDALPFDYQPPAAKITISAAKGHRESHYDEMRSVDNVLELPTDFAQTEALYIVAGRAHTAELEQLIQQAVVIADRYDRVAALDILFSRYVEIDPIAAVDYLLMIDLDVDGQIISSVFRDWARSDTNAAIATANSLVNLRQRKIAGDAVLRSVARGDPGMLNAVESQLADRHNLEYLQSEAIGIRANYDPQTALQEALSMKNINGRWDAIRRVGHVWARNDPVTAMDRAQSIGDLEMRRQFISSVLDRWIDDDPETAIQSLMANPNLQERNQYLQSGLRSYARSNPQHALLIASQLSGQAKNSVYQAVFSVWVQQDPEAAIQELAAMNSPNQRSLLDHIGNGLASTNPEAALQWVKTLDADRRAQYLPNILSRMAQSDPHRALEAALASDPSRSKSALARVLQQVGHSNPQLAMQYVSQLPVGRERDKLYTNISGSLAHSDPQAAMAWVSTLSGDAYIKAVTGLAGVIAQSDPDLAASMVGQVPDGERGALIQGISSAIAGQDPHLAMTWLSRFRSSSAYDAAAARVVMHLSHRDPQSALRIASELAPEHRTLAIHQALSRWARSDPVAASRWAMRSDTDQNLQAVGSVVQVWSRADPRAASRWVRSLRSGETKDQALASLVASSGFDTSEILSLINSIGSDTQRDQAIVNAYRRLRHEKNDIDAANAFLDTVGASDNVRQQVQPPGG